MKYMTKNKISDVTDVDGNKVFIENGEVKTLLREDIQKSGFMDLETARKILLAHANKLEQMYKNGNSNSERIWNIK